MATIKTKLVKTQGGELHSPLCHARHMGLYAIEPEFMLSTWSAIKAGVYRFAPQDPIQEATEFPKIMYQIEDRVALISMSGAMAKGYSKFAGVDTQFVRMSVRAAKADPEVGALLIRIDSPGGMVAGTEELANEIKNFGKPVFVQVEDCCSSAAYWISSSAKKIFANATAQIGSIGTFAVIEDTSKQAELSGVKVHVVSTGAMKGAGADGTPITPELLSELQSRIDQLNSYFLDAVKTGRAMESKDLKSVSDGRVWIAAEAKKLGLIDGIQGFDETFAIAAKAAAPRKRAMAEAQLNAS